MRLLCLFAANLLPAITLHAQPRPLPNTAPLTLEGDLSAQMVAGVDRFLLAEIDRAAASREKNWSPGNVEPNRARFARMIGLIDPRVSPVEVEYVETFSSPGKIAETDTFTAWAVRWPALEGLYGEGLLLQPKSPPVARVVALPDADQTPEIIAGLAPGLSPELQYARRLAENGCQVLVPTLLDRSDQFSGNPVANNWTNHPHREWIYRQSFVLGRHPIGYEVQKILAAVDWFGRQNHTAGSVAGVADPGPPAPIGVVGWGEGGLLAFYSAAVDPRIAAALVSGYFGPRERLWEEPLYRNFFGLLNEFGDAELAQLVLPRALLIEHAPTPKVDGPPPERRGRAGAAPGKITPLSLADVRAEFTRAQKLAGAGTVGGGLSPDRNTSALQLFHGPTDAPIGPIAENTLHAFLRALHPGSAGLRPAGSIIAGGTPALPLVVARQERQVRAMERFTQRQFQLSSAARDEFLWSKTKPTTPDAWAEAMRPYREKAWTEMIGRFPAGTVPLNPRTRFLREWPTITGYEVMVDVLPGVYAWGYLLVPKNIPPGEKRPVVVCQHGVTGLPESVVTEDPSNRAFATYQAFAVRLAERGFITFAPHNPYRGDHPSRGLQRKAQPIGKTIFSIILAQHEGILDFLSAQPNVDPSRIAFYGLSYGGQSAMRLPPLLERYALSICSGDFNEWTWKNATTDWPRTYLYNNAYERPEFRMGLTFGYAEMAALIAPRPFMVERGHDDSVAIDEWVAFEYAKVKRLYDRLGVGDRTEIEYFNGPHTIHGAGTFKFLHHHLNWPEPK